VYVLIQPAFDKAVGVALLSRPEKPIGYIVLRQDGFQLGCGLALIEGLPPRQRIVRQIASIVVAQNASLLWGIEDKSIARVGRGFEESPYRLKVPIVPTIFLPEAISGQRDEAVVS
jgi:hypothetical protein